MLESTSRLLASSLPFVLSETHCRLQFGGILSKMATFDTFVLNNGNTIPAIGLGTWDPDDPRGAYLATRCALEAGYRHLDCASLYGNEELVGQAILEFLQSHLDVVRNDLFITTKLWNHLHGAEDVEWSLDESLRKLGLDYVDLYLLHYPIATEKDGQYRQKKGQNGKVDLHHFPVYTYAK